MFVLVGEVHGRSFINVEREDGSHWTNFSNADPPCLFRVRTLLYHPQVTLNAPQTLLAQGSLLVSKLTMHIYGKVTDNQSYVFVSHRTKVGGGPKDIHLIE